MACCSILQLGVPAAYAEAPPRRFLIANVNLLTRQGDKLIGRCFYGKI